MPGSSSVSASCSAGSRAWPWRRRHWRWRRCSSPPVAAETIQTFGKRLRQQVDLDSLTAELLAVVDQTMQPTQAALWLRPRT
jgi:hypothetical protein